MIANIFSLLPTIIILIGALTLMLYASKSNKKETGLNLTLGFLTLALIVNLYLLKSSSFSPLMVPSEIFNSMLFTDSISLFSSALLIFLTIIVVLASKFYFDDNTFLRLEYFALILFALFGMILMSSGAELISLFIALEISSLSLYVLTGFEKRRDRSNEAILKYFILNSFIGAFFIMGVAFIYGQVGSTYILDIAKFLETASIYNSPLMLIGLTFVLISILFKVTAFPFQYWSVDVYFGANLPITAFLVGASKVAGFVFFVRVLLEGFIEAREYWQEILFFVTIFTLFIGNLLSFKQPSVKKMLIASSIVHSGYILVYISTINEFSIDAVSPILFYLFAYSIAITGAFTILSYFVKTSGTKALFENFKGLALVKPFSAFALTILMLSFVGYPLTIGFLGKFYLFASAMEGTKGTILVAFGIINTILSLYYYLRLIIYMYFYKDDLAFNFKASFFVKVTVSFIILTIIIGGFGLIIDIDNLKSILSI